MGEAGAKENPQPHLETTEVLPILNLEQQKEEAARTPSGMWCPLLCLWKFCGWERKQFVGLADIFLLCKYTPVGKLCFPLHLKFPKAKGHVFLLYCARYPTHYGWLINVTSLSFCIDWEWHFPRSFACFSFSANLTKCIHFPEKGHCLRPVFLAWISSPDSHQRFTHLIPGPVAFPPVLQLLYSLFLCPPAEFICNSLTPCFISLPSQSGSPLFYVYPLTLCGEPLMRLIIWAIPSVNIFRRKILFS